MPLYPQYAAATTATACDQAFRALMRMRWQPAVRVAPAYYEDPAYIDAIAASVRSHLATLDFEPETLIASFHGMPQAYLEAGDPYHCQCQKTSRLVRETLGWPSERWLTTFQSQFGNDPWLQPYTIDTVERLAKSGIKRLAMVAPGFSADCLETLEELDMENRARLPGQRRRAVRLHPLPQRQRRRRRRDRERGAPRADGLDLIVGCIQA